MPPGSSEARRPEAAAAAPRFGPWRRPRPLGSERQDPDLLDHPREIREFFSLMVDGVEPTSRQKKAPARFNARGRF
jgi:hypothetical protein